MKEINIADLAQHENQAITGFFAVSGKQVRSKKDGSRYFSLILADRTGQVDAVMWETDGAGDFAAGDVVKLRGQVCRYKEKLQINVERIRAATRDEFELGDLVPHTERNIDELWAELNAHVDSFTDPHLKALLRAFLDDAALAAAFTASTFGASTFGASAFGSSGATGPNMDGSDIEGSGMEGSDTGASAASLVSAAEAVTGSLDAPAEWETPALREPDSPPIGSGCWSLTVNSPLKIDHLVTFISCQILTWPRTYRKFRKWRVRFGSVVLAKSRLPAPLRREPTPG